MSNRNDTTYASQAKTEVCGPHSVAQANRIARRTAGLKDVRANQYNGTQYLYSDGSVLVISRDADIHVYDNIREMWIATGQQTA